MKDKREDWYVADVDLKHLTGTLMWAAKTNVLVVTAQVTQNPVFAVLMAKTT